MLLRKTLLVAAIIGLSCCAEQPASGPMKVTYVANTGFLIENGGKKILIDALFGNFESDSYQIPSDSLVDLMERALPPFDDIDIIAVTHRHLDHFDVNITAEHLIHNHDGVLVCPTQVEDKLSTSASFDRFRSRVRAVSLPVDSSTTITVAGVEIRVMRTPHSPYFETDTLTGEPVDRHRDVEHLEYVFDICGQKVYHSGDAYMNDFPRYEALGFDEDTISLAFVGWWDVREMLSFRQTLVRDVIRPDRIILMHLSPGRELSGNPENQHTVAREVYLPRQSMQTLEFPVRVQPTTD